MRQVGKADPRTPDAVTNSPTVSLLGLGHEAGPGRLVHLHALDNSTAVAGASLAAPSLPITDRWQAPATVRFWTHSRAHRLSALLPVHRDELVEPGRGLGSSITPAAHEQDSTSHLVSDRRPPSTAQHATGTASHGSVDGFVGAVSPSLWCRSRRPSRSRVRRCCRQHPLPSELHGRRFDACSSSLEQRPCEIRPGAAPLAHDTSYGTRLPHWPWGQPGRYCD